MAIEIDEPTVLETFLQYGLLVAAAFQLVCIFAVIFIPKSGNEQDIISEEARPISSGQGQSQSHVKKGKKEKKKFR